MNHYTQRTYRQRVQAEDLTCFRVMVKETDLWVCADQDLEKKTKDLVLEYRLQLEQYIRSHPDFLTTLITYPDDPYAPPMIREMIQATRFIEVGPMASVAGAIAEYVGNGLLEQTNQLIVENGGDIFIKTDRKATISIFAGHSSLSEKIGLVIQADQMPLGVCSSSGMIGHSLSMGSADVVCVLSSSAILADGAATAIGNKIKHQQDLEEVVEKAQSINGLLGCVAIMGDKMVTWGDVELVRL